MYVTFVIFNYRNLPIYNRYLPALYATILYSIRCVNYYSEFLTKKRIAATYVEIQHECLHPEY